MNIAEVRDYIQESSLSSKVYIGADSVRFKSKGQWYAEYTVCCIIHIDGNHGCKIFGEMKVERDYDSRQDRPATRLMNEVYYAAEVFEKLKDVLDDREVEIHLDLNPSAEHGSNCVIQQAIGYIKGVCGVTPMVKPEAPAASFGADRLKELIAC